MMQKNNPGSDLSFEQHLSAMSETGRTAITRKTLSAPTKKLVEFGVFKDKPSGFKVLDYGCGKGKDVEILQSLYPHLYVDGYDPNYKKLDIDKPYDIIICNYVLNVISLDKVREFILNEIKDCLSEEGLAYISVRNDKENLNGLTSIGTWQGYVELNLDVVCSNKSFKMYRMKKNV